ncbi:glycosyltransferase family 2 protein [Weissella soli]|uniref:glycosyltransferase family 2 protein n=1 Tax=Weissella soli TaxID=155866 RepID=UPI003C770814
MNRQNIELSIVVAIYNVRVEFGELLNELKKLSKISQVEVLFMNDGSTDGVEAILSKINYDNFITVTRQNGGLSYIRNEGLKLSQGRYVWFIDGDDIIDSSFVLRILKILEKQESDFIQFYYKRFSDSLGITFPEQSEKKLRMQWLSVDQWFSKLIDPKEQQFENYAWAHIVKRSIYTSNNVAFPIGRNYEDVATTYKLANKTSKILFIKNVAYYYRDRPGSITNSYTKIDVEDLLLSINEFKSNKLLVFSAKLKTNFTHRYLVGAYYMNMQLEDDLNKNLKKQLRSEILENNFLLLNLKFKFEYILFLFNIYEFYIGTKSFVKNYKGKP